MLKALPQPHQKLRSRFFKISLIFSIRSPQHTRGHSLFFVRKKSSNKYSDKQFILTSQFGGYKFFTTSQKNQKKKKCCLKLKLDTQSVLSQPRWLKCHSIHCRCEIFSPVEKHKKEIRKRVAKFFFSCHTLFIFPFMALSGLKWKKKHLHYENIMVLRIEYYK